MTQARLPLARQCPPASVPCRSSSRQKHYVSSPAFLPALPLSSPHLLLASDSFYFFLLGCQHGCFGERCRKSTSGPNDHLHLLQGAVCACKAVNKSLISLAARLCRAGRGRCFLEQLLNVKHCINKHKHT